LFRIESTRAAALDVGAEVFRIFDLGVACSRCCELSFDLPDHRSNLLVTLMDVGPALMAGPLLA
jgi:hypothetical protein